MRWKPGRHEYGLTVGGCLLSVECVFRPAAAQLILFLHGLACSRDSFRDVFGQRSFPKGSWLLPDLAGFGKSGKPEDFSYSMEDQAALIGLMLNLFPGREIHIVAHSMGNAAALLLSPGLWSRVRSFACVEGNLIGEDCGILSRGIAKAEFRDYASRIFPAQRREFSGHAQLRFAETTPLAVHRSARSLVQWSDGGRLLERFKKLACKKAYFWGEEDHAMPVLGRLQRIKTIMIPGSGHGMMTDNPEAFYRALAGFIGH